MRAIHWITGLALAIGSTSSCPAENWPQAGGPDRTWRLTTTDPVPTAWSVARDRHILWRTPLPNGGQSGIAVWEDRLFLTTFEPYKPGTPKSSATILGHCLDARTGKLLWSVKLVGSVPSPLMYAYSDSTSPTPVTDGKHVWFFNASGAMGCWDFDGKEVWRRTHRVVGDPYPFNKQHEPILFGDALVNVEPLERDARDKKDWNYLRGIDKATGKVLWTADDATTTYCTPVFGTRADGTPAVVHGRGGWHGVPERPVGLSMTGLAPGKEGRTLWRYVPDTGADGRKNRAANREAVPSLAQPNPLPYPHTTIDTIPPLR